MKKFNVVFDTGKLFRSVLSSMSYVGKVENVKESCVYCDYKMNINRTIQALIIMLLDTDTNFCVIDDKELEDRISTITYCKKVDLNKARYVIVDSDNLPYAIKYSNEGTLIDPHEGATIIVNCKDVKKGTRYLIKGPGINNQKDIFIDIDNDWNEIRKEKNKEFPLGIDLIFCDQNYNLLSIPRTTIVEKVK